MNKDFTDYSLLVRELISAIGEPAVIVGIGCSPSSVRKWLKKETPIMIFKKKIKYLHAKFCNKGVS